MNCVAQRREIVYAELYASNGSCDALPTGRHGRISIQGDDQRYIVHSDELLSAFLDLEATLLLRLLLFVVQDFLDGLLRFRQKRRQNLQSVLAAVAAIYTVTDQDELPRARRAWLRIAGIEVIYGPKWPTQSIGHSHRVLPRYFAPGHGD